jgi:hypothetical protein
MLSGLGNASREDELNRRRIGWHGLLIVRVDAGRIVQVFLLADREVRFDRVDLRDRGQRGGWRDQVADLHLREAHDAIDQRRDVREIQVQLRLLHLRLGRLHQCFGREIGLDVIVQLLLRNGVFLRQRYLAVDIVLGSARLCHVLGELSLGLVEHGLKRAHVDLEQDLTFADERAFFIRLADDVSRDLWPDIGVDVAIQRRDPFAVYRDIPLHDAGDFDLGRRRRGSHFVALATQ